LIDLLIDVAAPTTLVCSILPQLYGVLRGCLPFWISGEDRGQKTQMAAVDKRSGERAKSAMALTKWMMGPKVAQVHLGVLQRIAVQRGSYRTT